MKDHATPEGLDQPARPRRIYPDKPFLAVVAGLVLIGLFSGFIGSYLLVESALLELINNGLLVLVTIVLVLSVLDYLAIRTARLPTVSRQLPNTLSLHSKTPVVLHFSHPFTSAVTVEVQELLPADVEMDDMPLSVKLLPGRTSETSYELTPMTRGALQFFGIDLLQRSPLKLWQRIQFVSLPAEVKVYPNFSAIAGYSLLSTDNHVSQMGIKKRIRRGEGLEFHQLREYRRGDMLRQIDWKATSRRQKLISREYQDERDQQVVFLLDSGRRMRAKDDDLSHFDHAMNAMILLSYVALRQGDAVGLMTFGNGERWVPPQKSLGSINSLLNASYDLFPGTQAADYITAAQHFLRHQHKRSLVVIMTNTRDESVDDLQVAIKLLRKKHLVLLANLREEILDITLEGEIESAEDAMRYAGVHQYLQSRQRIHEQLHGMGVFTLNTTPAQLAPRVVNRYLDIKRSGYL